MADLNVDDYLRRASRRGATFRLPSIPDVGPPGTATNRARPTAPYPMGGLFGPAFSPSTNPAIPTVAAPVSPDMKTDNPVRDAIVEQLIRQSGQGGESGFNDPGLGFDTSDTPDVATPDAATPTTGPFGEDSAGSGKGISPAEANAAVASAPGGTSGGKGGVQGQQASAPAPATKGEPTAAEDAAALAAANQQAIQEGFMNPDGTPGKGVTTTQQSLKGEPPAAQPPSMTSPMVNTPFADAKTTPTISITPTTPEAPIQGPFTNLGIDPDNPTTAPATRGDPDNPAVAPQAPDAPQAPQAPQANDPNAPDIGKGINEALQSLTHYGDLDSVQPTMTMFDNVHDLNQINPMPPEMSLHDLGIEGPLGEKGMTFGRSSPEATLNSPTPASPAQQAQAAMDAEAAAAVAAASPSNAGITAAPGETIGYDSSNAQVAAFGDALAGAEAAQAQQGAPSGDAPADSPGISFGGTQGENDGNVGGSSLGGSAAVGASNAGQVGAPGESEGGLGGSNAGEGGGGPW